jgi:chloride channel protein, CIC family
MPIGKLYQGFLMWRTKNVSTRNLILILSVITGIGGGLAAVILKAFVHFVHSFLTENFERIYESYWYFIFPFFGILLTVLYKMIFFKGRIESGIPNLIYFISHRSANLKSHKMHSHMVSSGITVGFGGSVGLEAPIVTTGAAIGSNLGRAFHLDYKMRILLIGCGTAAAIGGIFNAPVAGVIFGLEVLLLELAIPAYIPVLIAAVTGTIVSRYLTGEEILFNFAATDEFMFREIPYFLLLGIVCGLIGVFVTRTVFTIEDLTRKISNFYVRALGGGIVLGFLIFLLPPLYGEGYNMINNLLQGNEISFVERSYFFHDIRNEWLIVFIIAGALLLKAFASAITLAAGGNGGIFAPSLFMGGLSGFLVARVINLAGFLDFELSEKNFVLAGMAGVMSGVQHAPLTAIFLIAEITGGYMLILPLMIVSAIAFATYSLFEKHSLYTKQLAVQGHFVGKDKDVAVLSQMKLDKLVEKDLIAVNCKGHLGDLVKAVTKSKRNIFPVIDDENILQGIIMLDDVREIMFQPEKYNTVKLREIMQVPLAHVYVGEPMHEVMRKFDLTGDWNLPVVDNEKKYVGFLSKSKIFNNYRTQLKYQAKEATI